MWLNYVEMQLSLNSANAYDDLFSRAGIFQWVHTYLIDFYISQSKHPLKKKTTSSFKIATGNPLSTSA